MKLALFMPLFLLSLIVPPCSVFAETPTQQIEQTVVDNLNATESEDIDSVMLTMHSDSPNRAATKAALPGIFETYDLKYEIVDYEFVSMSGKYAIARVKQRTTKVDGPAFRNNTVDSLIIFRQDKDKWAIWAQTILEIEFL